ncbi:hypothetical protein DFA_00816 [Cavenderia fasciculata]|uniref:Transmembrane protein n=1 Tax=Cavenderia fasciculata TaxID=261658 RepID=F4PTW8_CACFS|nr:uncharacterized protein DFA_00816 [Cavenderia fasciculata]EGG20947.1 hypothetical protein DFA_00816 [Cavenderia fasciculata]|eukprot:XP_004358797.1 hypothetical protein DFA_00816 [Cavenderia fasciculata]
MALADILHKTVTGTLFAVTIVGCAYIGVGSYDLLQRRKARQVQQQKEVDEFMEVKSRQANLIRQQKEQDDD